MQLFLILFNMTFAGVVAARRSLDRRHWHLCAIAVTTALWCGTALLAATASSKMAATRWYEASTLASLLVPSLLLYLVATDRVKSRWLPLVYVPAGGLALLVVFQGVVRPAFKSPLGWLSAPGPLSPALGAWLVVLYLATTILLVWTPPPWLGMRVLQVPVLVCLVPLLAKDVWPLFSRDAWYLPWTPYWVSMLNLVLMVRYFRTGQWLDDASPPTEETLQVSARPAESRDQWEALQASEERLRALIEHASDCMLILAADASIHYHSPALRRMLSQHTTYMPGTNFLGYVHPDDRQSLTDTLLQLVEEVNGSTVQVDFRMHRKKEEWASMHGSATNLLQHRYVKGIVLNLRDVSHSRQLENQLMRAQKMEAVGRLAGGVAHDFNNLLTAIQGYTDILLRSVALGTDDRECLEQIMSASERAAALTQQLLAFSRQKTIVPQNIELNDVLDGMRDMLKHLLGDNVQMDMRLAPDIGAILADPVQIQQIIMNLAVNARDAMPGGGLLTVETRSQSVSEDQRAWSDADTLVVLTVSDTGAGIGQEILAHIFEPFFTTKGVGKGTGLGLSIVYGFIQASGGHIEVDSAPGQGSTFRIFLPQTVGVVSPKPARVTPPRPGPVPFLPTRRETVLVVEDAEVIRRLAERILSAKGYHVLVASDGNEAMRISREFQRPIHLLLTDVVMPNMNGIELAENLSSSRPDMKVLFMSGYVPESNHGKVMPNTLEKPFTAGVLVAKVREVLRPPAGVLQPAGGGVLHPLDR